MKEFVADIEVFHKDRTDFWNVLLVKIPDAVHHLGSVRGRLNRFDQ